MKKNENIVVLEYNLRLKIFYFICVLFVAAFTVIWGHMLRRIFFIVVILDVLALGAFIYLQTSRVIIDKRVDYVVQCIFWKKKKVYYKDMAYVKVTEDDNTVYLVVYSIDDKKLLKVNMGGYTNTEYFSQIITSMGLELVD
ncbi:MAG: hypothetical protein Q4Q31_04715 [Bacillota bacterium]|nr:hypothetical protein [Bacillota bacterium]